MADLTAGQNSELGSYELTFTVHPTRVTVAAIVLDDQRRALPRGYIDPARPSRHPGIKAHPGRLSVWLDAVTAEAARVLCVALDPRPGTDALCFTLTDGHGQSTGFTVAAAACTPRLSALSFTAAGHDGKYARSGRATPAAPPT